MTSSWRPLLASAWLAIALVAGCSGIGKDIVSLEPAFGGVAFDNAIDLADLGDGTFLVAEQSGLVRHVSADGARNDVVLDLSEAVAHEHEEQGLLSLTLDPAFPENRHAWLYYVAPGPLRSVVARYHWPGGSGFEESSALVVLEVEQPYENHNGGTIRFGPDGMLYLGLGDGGDVYDPHGHAQDLSTLLGSIVRIDVRDANTLVPYRIPPGNPFLSTAGARPETWAYGFRNPWRMAFDSVTGDLWAGDVGQHDEEEVDVVQAGGNYGWPLIEGNLQLDEDAATRAFAAPVYAYGHDEGCAITGGVVYRGSEIPALTGRYLFGDLCSDQIWTLTPEGERRFLARVEGPLVSFAEGAEGEVYVLQFGQPIMRLAPH